MERKQYDPENRARALNDECVQMVERREKPWVIRPVREAYLQALTQAERYKGIIRVPVPRSAIPPHMTYVEDEICRWPKRPMK